MRKATLSPTGKAIPPVFRAASGPCDSVLGYSANARRREITVDVRHRD